MPNELAGKFKIAVAVLAVAMSGCAVRNTAGEPANTGGKSLRTVEGVQMHGHTYDCIVANGVGSRLGGVWCVERKEGE